MNNLSEWYMAILKKKEVYRIHEITQQLEVKTHWLSIEKKGLAFFQ